MSELKGNNLVTVENNPNMTVYKVSTQYPFTLNKDCADSYLKDARKVLDKLSEEFNPVGIEEIIGALIYTMFVDDYYGKENGR